MLPIRIGLLTDVQVAIPAASVAAAPTAVTTTMALTYTIRIKAAT